MTRCATVIETPVGALLALFTTDGTLTALPFLEADTDVEAVARRYGGRGIRWDAPRADALRTELTEYFAGDRRTFSIETAPEGTPFQLEVWRALERIPYGGTLGYGELARRLGRPSASRAVGRANGANPIPIVIPCHRVIGANGTLTGYGGGSERKRALLRLEGAIATALPL